MKNRIKKIYKDKPELAKEIAEVLGYRVVVKAGRAAVKKQILDPLKSSSKVISDVVNNFTYLLQEKNLALPGGIERETWETLRSLSSLRSLVEKFIDKNF